MLKHITYTLLIALLLVSSVLFAQLSPGELYSGHAHLEGLSNCTKCHTLGDKVSNAKCLDCHKELDTRIDAGKGFHVSAEVKGQDCFKCHSEHHGRGFDIVRFDTERFDHDLTGYPLEGAHSQLECAECHKDAFIADRQLRLKKETYLGLNTACLSCHQDYHQSTLSTDCASCHTAEAFVPASRFSHDKSDFPLRGAHRDVDCASCHAVSEVIGVRFQQFSGVAFSNCSSCHEDVHDGRFGTNCKECHIEESFHVLRGMGDFNHSKTGFPLLGKHKTISCNECHDTQTSTDQMFKDFVSKDVSNCVACHDDVHEQRFGIDCRACHSEESFRAVRNFTALEHEKTAFPLEGKHETVDCRKCHDTQRMTEPLAHNACAECHSDFHEGQFVSVSRTPDCVQCHTVDGFAGSTYTIEQHNAGRFTLSGAHLATPCFACHLREEKWLFRNIGMECIDCHDDIHAGSIADKYYPEQACTHCHSTESWRSVSFDHAQTEFVLEGSHVRQACTACHKPESMISTSRRIVFTGLKTDCVSCHTNTHRDQFSVDGTTDCTRCHGNEHWKPSVFDHSTARFVLEGAHVTVECAECHRETVADGETFVLYRLEKFACVDCHE